MQVDELSLTDKPVTFERAFRAIADQFKCGGALDLSVLLKAAAPHSVLDKDGGLKQRKLDDVL